MRKAIVGFVVLFSVLSGHFEAAAVDPGILDGVWLKMTVTSTGLAIESSDTASRKRARFKALCYGHLTWGTDAQGEFYTGRIICEEPPPPVVTASGPAEIAAKAPKSWTQMPDTLRANILADGAALVVDDFLMFQDADEAFIGGYGTHILEPKVNKKGELKKIKMSTLGAEVTFGSADAFVSSIYGSYKIVGTSVASTKLPDGVEAALVPLP